MQIGLISYQGCVEKRIVHSIRSLKEALLLLIYIIYAYVYYHSSQSMLLNWCNKMKLYPLLY